MFKQLGKKYRVMAAGMLAVLAFALVSSASASDGLVCPRDTFQKILADVAYRSDQMRRAFPNEMKIWMDYKNGSNPDPIKVDLSNMCALGSACPILMRDHPTPREYVSGDPSVYERLVLSLKKGDTIVFDGHEYTLGDFLGAGNMSHVYAIAGTRTVIRLPFVSDFVWARLKRDRRMTQAERMRKLLDGTLAASGGLKRKKGSVAVYKTDTEGRFMITHKVYGTFSGEKLLRRIVTYSDGLTGKDQLFYPAPGHFKSEAQMTALEREQFAQLLELMKQNGEASVDVKTGLTKVVALHSRQYIWDANDSRWYLVDSD